MAFDTNIATQTVEYQNLDRLVLKNGHVVLIGDESIDVWISEELMDDGHDCNYTLPFQPAWAVRAEERVADKAYADKALMDRINANKQREDSDND
tara:strand:- start:32 stop:316 length:285 start_codon:yes stop_codon:yes gene_type:complete